MTHPVEVRRLIVRYPGARHGRAAVDDVSLHAAAGEILGVLGPNGSGKSTLLSVLAGGLPPTRGEVRVLGRHPDDPVLLRQVGFQPEGPLPFRGMAVRTFLRHLGDLLGMPRDAVRRRVPEVLDAFALAGVAGRQVGRLSTGMARRLALAGAMLPDPRVLILDEPTAGLDPEGSLLVIEQLRGRASRLGCTVVLASHHLQEIEQLCTRVVMLVDGRVAEEGSLDQLLGTDARTLTVEGLGDDAMPRLRAAVAELGGRVADVGRQRAHLFELFRRLGRGSGGTR